MSELIEDLRADVAGGQVVVVVGAGVSVAASGRAAMASWPGLLEHGIARVQRVCAGRLPGRWAEIMRMQVASGDVGLLLAVAEQVTERLGGRGGGEFRRWLRESVGSLEVVQRPVLDALAGLAAPVATTNYDGLLEQVTGWPAVTWRDGARVQRVVRGDEPGVMHLHGSWEQPESVVLGIRSYEAVLGDAAAQAVQRALATMRGLLLVGFGAGLADPNFGALRAAYERARPLYERVGDVQGQASCIRGLGDIALRRSDYEGARVAYERARPLFERVGSMLGQANCIRGLGDIALARSDREAAHISWCGALELYEQIPEPYSIGRTHRLLARAAASDADRARHVAAARDAWMAIHRTDLVIDLDGEFPGS